MILFVNLFHKIAKIISSSFRKQEMQIVILFTSDIHGCIYPFDYARDHKTGSGLAKIAGRVEEYRRKYENVILLDNGDSIQGSPLNYYYNYIDKESPYPVAAVMNMMQYTAASVGHADVEQGPEIYKRIVDQFKFPVLSANANTKSGKSFFQPFTVRELNGLTIGVLGLTTPGFPPGLSTPAQWGIRWQDMRIAAKGWASYFKGRKETGILIGLFHAGVHPETTKIRSKKSVLEENPCLEIAANQPEYDVIIAGHEHETYNSHPKSKKQNVKEPLVVMAGSHGRNLGVIRLKFRHSENEWRLYEKYAEIESMGHVKPSHPVMKTYQPYHEKMIRYMNSRIGKVDAPGNGRELPFEENWFVDIVHRAQLDATTADISLVSSGMAPDIIADGVIHVKDVYRFYPAANFLMILLLSGKQVKNHLERSAKFFNRLDPENPVRVPLVDPDAEASEYDTARGVSYDIDITRKPGVRITRLFSDAIGKPLDLKKTYKVVVNSDTGMQLYRKYGCRILWKSSKEVREIVIEFIQNQKRIRAPKAPSWRLTPKRVVQAVLSNHNQPD